MALIIFRFSRCRSAILPLKEVSLGGPSRKEVKEMRCVFVIFVNGWETRSTVQVSIQTLLRICLERLVPGEKIRGDISTEVNNLFVERRHRRRPEKAKYMMSRRIKTVIPVLTWMYTSLMVTDWTTEKICS
jgi:hypothetical protein